MKRTLVLADYPALLEKVRRVLLEGRARAKRALEHEEVRTWWKAARAVNVHLRNHRGRAAYGRRIILKLARDLGVSDSYLYDILQFQKTFSISHSSGKLTLSHYRVLSRIEEATARRRLYREAVREKLTVPELLGEIRSRKLLAPADLQLERETLVREGFKPAPEKQRTVRPLPPLKPRRGKFFAYRVIQPRGLQEHPDFYSIDLGFGNRYDLRLSGIQHPQVGEIIEAIRTQKDSRGDRYRFKRVDAGILRPQDLLYTYKATVTRVVDDDTLWANIDLGFRFWTERKLRFRGIDAAEIDRGKQASDFVKRTLARVPFVVLSVTGRDKFGRPLADVFYLEGTEDREKVLREGIYLNQQLLDRSLAQRV